MTDPARPSQWPPQHPPEYGATHDEKKMAQLGTRATRDGRNPEKSARPPSVATMRNSMRGALVAEARDCSLTLSVSRGAVTIADAPPLNPPASASARGETRRWSPFDGAIVSD